MKKLMVGFCVAGTLVCGAALAADDGFYAGVTLGRSSTGSVASDAVMTKSNDTVGGVLAG